LLLVFVWIAVSVNMILSFTFGKLFRFSLEEIILASNANIGGPSTAAAMAIAKGWRELIVPILLVGTLGYITLYKVPLQKKVEDCNWEHVHQ
jgi:uncharacterized membrane protein